MSSKKSDQTASFHTFSFVKIPISDLSNRIKVFVRMKFVAFSQLLTHNINNALENDLSNN